MAGEQIEIVIDANGLARTEQVFRSLDKYMERLHMRAARLGRMQIRPVVQFIDRVTEPLERIKKALKEMSATSWTSSIVLDPKIDSAVFKSKGEEALGAFSEGFIDNFDSEKLAKKVQESLEGISVDVNVNPSGGGSNWDEVATSFGTSIAAAIVYDLGKLGLKGLFGKRTINKTNKPKTPSKTNKPDKPSNPAMTNTPGKKLSRKEKKKIKKSGQPESQNYANSNPGKRNNEQRRGGNKGKNTSPNPPVPNANKIPKPKGSKFGKIFDFGKNFLSGGPNVNSMVGISTAGNSGMLGNVQIGKGTANAAGSMAKSALKLGGRMFRPLSLVTDAMAISSARPGEERNKAIGGAVGGWGGAAAGAAAGAAIGSIIPGIGTAIGGVIGGAIGGLGGSALGEKVGAFTSKASDTINDMGNKVKGFFFGSRKKEKEPNPAALSAPARPNPVAFPDSARPNPAALPAPATAYPARPTPLTGIPTSMPINVNVPYGAIQITVNSADIDYDQISNRIGGQLASSIQQAVENRS
ncbi:hypothetical protein ACF3MZ_29235 [Paenibacillaceae bacterium WGS1546]|uniref:hypothetical protein n=1 Tax=Cohnella sp. WGS1546 TaxID=3366810 RepID=UPI00372D2970